MADTGIVVFHFPAYFDGFELEITSSASQSCAEVRLRAAAGALAALAFAAAAEADTSVVNVMVAPRRLAAALTEARYAQRKAKRAGSARAQARVRWRRPGTYGVPAGWLRSTYTAVRLEDLVVVR